MRRTAIASFLFFLSFSHANAAFKTTFCGYVTIVVDKAPVRLEYPDGRIVKVLEKGSQIYVEEIVGDGTGVWIIVGVKRDDIVWISYLDADLTDFLEGMSAKRVYQPEPENGAITCPPPEEREQASAN